MSEARASGPRHRTTNLSGQLRLVPLPDPPACEGSLSDFERSGLAKALVCGELTTTLIAAARRAEHFTDQAEALLLSCHWSRHESEGICPRRTPIQRMQEF